MPNNKTLSIEDENAALKTALNWATHDYLRSQRRQTEAIEVLQQASIICDDEAVKEKLWLAIGILNCVVK